MPLFFFDYHDSGAMPDNQGVELPDCEAAKEEALRVLPRIAADDAMRGDHRPQHSVVVTDEDGHAIYAATLSCVGVWLLHDNRTSPANRSSIIC